MQLLMEEQYKEYQEYVEHRNSLEGKRMPKMVRGAVQ